MGSPVGPYMPPRPAMYASMGPYITKLNPTSEAEFQHWFAGTGLQDTPDYDMRGFWAAKQAGDPLATQASTGHYPDIWKTPEHQSFSNESKYALPGAPHWTGNKLVSDGGDTVFDEDAQQPQKGFTFPAKKPVGTSGAGTK